jgi:CRISPR/Cas system-associated exonuclease Cas4 (RecB family)
MDVLKALQEAGVQIVEQQRAMEWKEHQIIGHVDAVAVIDGQSYPLDVKSMSAHIWDSIFTRGKGVYQWSEVGDRFMRPWLRKYLGQVILYCLLKETEEGMLICKNKSTGALAQVNIPLDYSYAESLIQRADRINRHVSLGTLPDRIPWDDACCGKCKFLAICLPDRVGKDPLVFLEDSTVVEMLDSRARLEEAGREFKRIDEKVKDWAKARPETKIAIGPFLVEKKVSPKMTRVEIVRV